MNREAVSASRRKARRRRTRHTRRRTTALRGMALHVHVHVYAACCMRWPAWPVLVLVLVRVIYLFPIYVK
jgi:hypothetical protein